MMVLKDYVRLLENNRQDDYNATLQPLIENLISFWVDDYSEMTSHDTEIVEFKNAGFSFLFDLAKSSSETFIAGETKEARVVVAYGVTQKNSALRDKSRLQGFIGGFEGIPRYEGYDKGHFISHKIGGMLDQNLFPQKKETNRGWSEEGKKFRDIERFCERNEGIFMFSRPLYTNASWIPSEVEIGYLAKDFTFVIENVSN